MDLLKSYTENDAVLDQPDPNSSQTRFTLRPKSTAPQVDDTMLALSDPTRHIVSHNATYDQTWAPPSNWYGIDEGMRDHKLGFFEDVCIDKCLFDAQYDSFCDYGVGIDYVCDMNAVRTNDDGNVCDLSKHGEKKRKIMNQDSVGEGIDDPSGKREGKREGVEIELTEDQKKYVEENAKEKDNVGERIDDPSRDEWLVSNRMSPWSGKREEVGIELTEEQKKYVEEYAKRKGEKKDTRDFIKGVADKRDKSLFHGKEERDYQGRSWIACPKDVKVRNEHCYVPKKKLVHTWRGHTKGVSAIRFFPKHGHLILSAGKDSKVKIWDVFNSRECMRTYMGHLEAVRDVSFCNDGSKFLSAGFDKDVKYWDTETGKVISTFSTGKVANVVKLNPDDDKQNVLLAGTSDKKIVQWDVNTGKITQEYDQHLGGVNTITFVDDNRRFVSSGDDMSLRVWEFGIPVVIKCISEPHMHSMPSISVHPNSNWLAAQSLDSQILVYSTRERFQLNKKKRFAGHLVGGYACQVNFSSDGRFVMSGDGDGNCWFWDWKSCRVSDAFKCHEGVCIGCEWHPLEQSKVATCGWDGLIKYWD